uniref:Putative ovule protein n=1 Tax=Solanum chacoense TaxID=4108 RepID=A0A0V0HHT7_SOLCH
MGTFVFYGFFNKLDEYYGSSFSQKLGNFDNHLVCFVCVCVYIYVYIYIIYRDLSMSRNSLDCVSKLFVQIMCGILHTKV